MSAADKIRELQSLSDKVMEYNDGRFHLEKKFYAPRPFVTQYHLDQFTYELEEEIELADGSTETVKVPLYLWQEHGGMYSFHRGDLQKIMNLWPEILEEGRMVDHRSCPEITIDLQLKEGFQYRSYKTGNQYDALMALLEPNLGGILKAFPSFGKTVIMTLLAICQRRKVLLLAHKSDLLDQFESTVRAITNIDDFWEDGQCWNMYRLDKRYPAPNIGTSTFQYLLANPEFLHTISNDYAIVMADECHHIGGDGFTQTFLSFNAFWRYGFTATDYRKDGMDQIFSDVMGPVRHVVERPPLQVDGVIHDTDVVVPSKYTYAKFPMNLVHNFLKNCEERNAQIARNAIDDALAGYIVIVLVYRVEGIDLVYEEIRKQLERSQKLDKNYPLDIQQVEWIYRDFSKADREAVKERLFDGGNPDTLGGSKIVITTSQLFGEGSDIAILSSLHFCYPSANNRELEQVLGRIMREHKWKPARNKITFYRDKSQVPQVSGMQKGWVNRMRGFGVNVYDPREAKSGQIGQKLGLYK